MGFHDSIYDADQMRELLCRSATQVSKPHSILTLETPDYEWVDCVSEQSYGPFGAFKRPVPSRQARQTMKPVNVVGQGWVIAVLGRIWGQEQVIDSSSYVALVLRTTGVLEEVSWEQRRESPWIEHPPAVQPGLADAYDPRLAAFRMDFAEAVSGHNAFRRPEDALFLERDFTRPVVASKGEGLRLALAALLDGDAVATTGRDRPVDSATTCVEPAAPTATA